MHIPGTVVALQCPGAETQYYQPTAKCQHLYINILVVLYSWLVQPGNARSHYWQKHEEERDKKKRKESTSD